MAVVRLPPLSTVEDTGYTPVGAATEHECVDDPVGPPTQHDGADTYIAADDDAAHCLFLTDRMPDASGINSVKVYGVGLTNATWSLAARKGSGGSLEEDAGHSNGTFQEFNFTVPAPGGGWTQQDVDDLRVGVSSDAAGGKAEQITIVFKEIDYDPAPVAIEQHRLVGTQLLLQRLEQALVRMSLPLVYMDLDAFELFALSHLLLPTENGLGIGTKRWERKLMMLLGGQVDPMTDVLDIEAWDVRKYLSAYLDSGQLRLGVANTLQSAALAPSVARLSMGGTRQFNRASKAFALDPSGLIWKEFQDDSEAISRDGILLEDASTTRIWNPAFINGHTNWTKINDGTGGVSVALDTTRWVFEKSALVTTAQSTRITNGAATSGAIQQTTNFSFSGSSKLTVSMIHGDDATGSQWTIRIRNVTTGNWLQSNGTWAAGEANAFAPGNKLTPTRSFGTFTMEATGSTLLVKLQYNGASKVGNLYHVQIEATPGSSPIVEAAASDTTRALANLRLSNDFGKRVFDIQHGYVAVEAIPGFDHGGPSGSNTLFSIEIDASNFVRCFYDNTQSNPWTFVIRAGGTSYRAEAAGNAVRGVARKIVCRWTNTEGQLGLTDENVIFVDGVKGAVAVTHVKPAWPESLTMHLGSIAGTSTFFNGQLRRIRMGRHVPSDLEVQGLLP